MRGSWGERAGPEDEAAWKKGECAGRCLRGEDAPLWEMEQRSSMAGAASRAPHQTPQTRPLAVSITCRRVPLSRDAFDQSAPVSPRPPYKASPSSDLIVPLPPSSPSHGQPSPPDLPLRLRRYPHQGLHKFLRGPLPASTQCVLPLPRYVSPTVDKEPFISRYTSVGK